MSQPKSTQSQLSDQATLFGHPTGLYTLFFAEMWERFSFYGMRALLILYLAKGFLKYNDTVAYTIYGAYTALVYMTPFFGGMLADRILGARRAVILGGLLMAIGSSCLMVENGTVFYIGLGLQIVGNGFFKPNISNIVGTLYRQFPRKRDGGFTIFYIGINLGAAIAPLLCGFIGENYGWSYGFGLATIGMLIGLAVFVVAPWIAQVIIATGSVAAVYGLLRYHPNETVTTAVGVFVAIALAISASVAVLAIQRGGLPKAAGDPPDAERLKRRLFGWLPVAWAVYLGAFLMAPCFMLLVSGGASFRESQRPWAFVEEGTIKKLESSDSVANRVFGVVLKQTSTPAGIILVIATILAFGYLLLETIRLDTIARHRMWVVLILMFFCMLFWSFFEQAGSSISNFTDRNVDRVFDRAVVKTIEPSDVGKTIVLEPTQEQLGYRNGEQMFTLNTLNKLLEDHKKKLETLQKDHKDAAKVEAAGMPALTISWKVMKDNVGMKIANQSGEIPASAFQAVNPIYILLLGLVFTALWTFLGTHGLEPSTPFKFAMGLLQLGLGFVALWYGAASADSRGMVSVWWLLLAYLLHTTAELCLSPVGLSMVTKLSPTRLVSTVMGGWFLATAVSQFLGGIIAQFTRVGDDESAAAVIPPPIETVHVYGNVFAMIAISAGIAAAVCFCLVPLLKRWMHENEDSPAT